MTYNNDWLWWLFGVEIPPILYLAWWLWWIWPIPSTLKTWELKGSGTNVHYIMEFRKIIRERSGGIHGILFPWNAGNTPANAGHCPCVGSMLAHRLRRWPNIEPTHGQCPVFSGPLLVAYHDQLNLFRPSNISHIDHPNIKMASYK